MLKKLLKYDFKALLRLLVPFIIAVPAAYMLSGLLTGMYTNIADSPDFGTTSAVFLMLTVISYLTIYLASLAFVLFVMFIFCARFYKSLFSDEGYLTFTLPATPKQHLGSKIISAFTVMLGAVAVIIISIFLFTLSMNLYGMAVGTEHSPFTPPVLFEETAETFTYLFGFESASVGDMIVLISELTVNVVFGILSQILLLYLAISLGSMIAKKQKILISVLMYFAINFAVGQVSAVIFTILAVSSLNLDSTTISELMLGGTGILYVITSTVFYLICKKIVTKHINLE